MTPSPRDAAQLGGEGARVTAAATVADVLAGRATWCVVEGDAMTVARSMPVAQGTRNADVARLMWASVEAVEAAFALWSRARRVIERCGRAEERR